MSEERSHKPPPVKPVLPPGIDAEQAETIYFALKLQRATPHLYVTHILVALNVLVFVLMVLSGTNVFSPDIHKMLAWGANFGPYTTSGEWIRLILCNYLHFGLLHLALNMWCLWQLGQLCERLFGNGTFLLIYTLSGLGGSALSLFWNPGVVSAGASGAVFGIGGALVAYTQMQKGAIPPKIYQGLFRDAGLFLVLNTGFGLSIPNIDNAGHIGGMLFGMGAGVLLARPLDGERPFRISLAALAVALTAGFMVFAGMNAGTRLEHDKRAVLAEYEFRTAKILKDFGVVETEVGNHFLIKKLKDPVHVAFAKPQAIPALKKQFQDLKRRLAQLEFATPQAGSLNELLRLLCQDYIDLLTPFELQAELKGSAANEVLLVQSRRTKHLNQYKNLYEKLTNEIKNKR